MDTFTELKTMTKKQLKQELVSVEEHIENFSYGKYELYYREAVLRELDARENK
jgi:hypothetical protein